MDTVKLQEDIQAIKPGLGFRFLESIDSTNRVGMDMVSKGPHKNTLLVAERQTHGKGRWDRKWESDNDDGVWASLVVFDADDMPRFVRALSVAIAETVQTHVDQHVNIKWPNDVLIEDRKVSGLLAESAPTPSGERAMVLGFGINVNQQGNSFSDEISAIATSIRIASGKTIPVEQILVETIEHLYDYLENRTEELFAQYKSLCSTIGRKCLVDDTRMYVKDISWDGGLVVLDPDGGERVLYSGTVVYE